MFKRGRFGFALRSRLTSTTTLVAATAAVVVMAVTVTGVPVSHVAANDGGVWLVNDTVPGSFGEFNVPIKQLSATVPATSTPQSAYSLDVLQAGATVIAIDYSNQKVYPVNVATTAPDKADGVAFPTGGIALPGDPVGPGDGRVAMGDDVVALLEPGTATTSGRVWATNIGNSQTPSLDALNSSNNKPTAVLPGAEAVAVDTAGDVYLASTTKLMTVPATGAGFGPPKVTPFSGPLTTGAVRLTTVGTTPVVMDGTPSKPVLLFPLSGQPTTLPGTPSTNGFPAFELQQSGPPSSSVLVASSTHLYSVPLGGGSTRTLATLESGGGAPAQPVLLDGCSYAAWSGSPGFVARSCPGSPSRPMPLTDQTSGPIAVDTPPVFRVNNNEIVLNDPTNGDTWTVTGRPDEVLNNQDWQKVIRGETAQSTRASQPSQSANASQLPTSPVLNNPTLYARTGMESLLHVLDDDSDPGGSLLAITSVTPSGPGFSARISSDNQTVILSLKAGQVAPVVFSYEVVDGFGLTRSGTVEVDPTTGETPPVPPSQPIATRHVVSSGTVSMQVLGDWRDHENDGLSLDDASVPAGAGAVTWTSDGLITYSAPSVSQDTQATITYQVTDGRSSPVASQFQLDVLGRGDLNAYPPDALPDATEVTVGKPTAFSPLANDIFGADPLDPHASLALAGPVTGEAAITVATNATTGELTFAASQPGTYSLHYQATFGSGESPVTQILVVAVAPADGSQEPVTTPVSMVLHGQYATTVDVLQADYDPAGGLLSTVGVTAPSDLQATIVDSDYLRIVATTPNPLQHQIVSYQVSNGVTDPVSGQVSVNWVPALPPTPPVVPDTYANVRAGDEVDVPVLLMAGDPDGESVHLLDGVIANQGSHDAVSVAQTNPGAAYPTGLGSASISGQYLRFAAPPQGVGAQAITGPEQVTLFYVVESQAGERTTGSTYITIHPDVPSQDSTPAPGEVAARVTSGGAVTIPIPTTDDSPDGDSVSVTGVTSAPRLGRIMSTNATSVTYQAYPVSAGSGTFTGGTDSFDYQVEGPSGLTAQSVIRVSVTSPSQAQAPVAVDHDAMASPGKIVDVDLLAGDIVSPGDQVTVEPLTKVNATVPTGAALVGHNNATLQVTAPSGAAPLSVAYAITDGASAPSVAHVVVRDEPGFAVPPDAVDEYPAAPAAGARTLTVDVLGQDSDPGGTANDLRLTGSPVPGVVVSGAHLVIPVTRFPRSVPYEIKSETTGATAVGVVHVRGSATGPQLIPGKAIQVPKGGSTTITIGNYITDATHPVRLTETDEVSASPAGGLSEQVDSNTTITLNGASGYVGPGSLTVQVIDASTLSAAGAHIATFSIPVQVGPPTPVIRCPSTPLKVVESGPPVNADIAGLCQVWTPNGASPTTLTYTESWAQSVPGLSLGWEHGHVGHVVSISASSSALGGSIGRITVGVAGAGPTADSTLEVQSIEAGPASVSAIAIPGVQTGSPTKIDMAQYVSSPLAQPQITVISVGAPNQGSAQVTHSGAEIDITPSKGTHGVQTFPVEVSDQGPSRTDRFVAGTITLQVLDNPDTPTALQGVPGDNQVQLSWQAAADNGAPIEYYAVTLVGGTTQRATGTSLTWTGLQNGVSYTFHVTAHNQVGDSPGFAQANFEPNSVPEVVANVVAVGSNAQATVTWTAPFDGGKTIDEYIVSISPASGSATAIVPGTQTTYHWTNLDNAVGPYTFTVVAHNSNGVGPVSASSNAVYAHGTPARPSAPTASGAVSTDQKSTTITVTWPGIPECNDAQPCAGYTVTELSGGRPVTSASVTGGQCGASAATCSASFGPLTNTGAGYTYTLTAANHEGDVSTASAPSAPTVYASGYPDQITGLSLTPGDTQITATFTLPPSNSAGISRVDYNASGVTGSWSNPGASGQTVTETISGLTNGNSYSVTVEACSESADGNSGGCGQPSSAAPPAVPYGTPFPPSISASQSGNSIVYSWSGGGNNGRPVSSYHICIDGGCNDYSAPGSTTVGYACGTGHSITGYVVDTMGQSSTTNGSSANTMACPQPQVTVSWGTKSGTCPQDASCTWLNVSWTNFTPGTHAVNANCSSPGCTGGTFPTVTVSGSSGSLNNYYYIGFCGHAYQVYATVDSTQSNTLLTNSHSC
jgi:large repetitive protein